MSMNKFFYPIDSYTFFVELIDSFEEFLVLIYGRKDIARQFMKELEIDPIIEQLETLLAMKI